MIEQVLGIRNPVTNDEVLVEGLTGYVSYVVRYNGSGRFTSIVACAGTTGCYDLVWDNATNIWIAQSYVPERYPDLDGVNKKM